MHRSGQPCLYCGTRRNPCLCAANGRRRNPDGFLVTAILKTLPEDARAAYATGASWEQAPQSVGAHKPWALEGDVVWERAWFVPGFRINGRRLYRTIWRFDEDGDRQFVDQIDVADSAYFVTMEAYGEDGRVQSWRDYFQWVCDNFADPLNELGLAQEGRSQEQWVVVLRDFSRNGRSLAAEVVGAKCTDDDRPRAFKTPDALPAHVRSVLSIERDGQTGAWLLDISNYANFGEAIRDLKARGAQCSFDDGGEMCRAVVSVPAPAQTFTPRTEAIREAARAALEQLGPVSNPRGRRARPKPKSKTRKMDLLQVLLEAAEQHGQESEPEHEVGDLQGLLHLAWRCLTQEQQKRVATKALIDGLAQWMKPDEVVIDGRAIKKSW